MQTPYNKFQDLFLQQSYLDAWGDYEKSLIKSNFIKWDYVILTASNEEQAIAYRLQIDYRLENGLLPETTNYAVLSDPDGKRVGSGGATLNVLRYIYQQSKAQNNNHFINKRILVIHSGGDSKRVPQYSVCGKLFSPVPRELPSGYASTLFDEFIIGLSGVPSRIHDGMLVISGDVLLLFNPLQIDLQYNESAVISIKKPVETGTKHGVFLNDGENNVGQFLHKQTKEKLKEIGAVNTNGMVDLDTGVVVMDTGLLNALFSLISTDNKIDENKFNRFVNDRTRISFYGDFLYPLAKNSTIDNYYKETAEGSLNKELLSCRKEIWRAISNYQIKLICLSPAEFIHLGTTKEMLNFVTTGISNYEFLGFENHIQTNINLDGVASYNSYIEDSAVIESSAYIEHSFVLQDSKICENAVVSNVKLVGEAVPKNTVVHGVKLKNGKYVVRVYGTADDPKVQLNNKALFLGTTIKEFIINNKLDTSDLWDNVDYSLWYANLYPVCDTMEEALSYVKILHNMSQSKATIEEINRWKLATRMSLYSSFNTADISWTIEWQRILKIRILISKFKLALEQGVYYADALRIFGGNGITQEICNELLNDAIDEKFSIKIRIYYALSRYIKDTQCNFKGISYDLIESLCFAQIKQYIYNNDTVRLKQGIDKIKENEVNIKLPLRVNWGGGWTDTPPYCNDNGGVVLNAAIKLKGILPVLVTIKRIDKLHIEFESADIGAFGIVTSVEEILDCTNPYDSFALHKSALIACGIVPLQGKLNLKQLCDKMGGGMYLSTQVIGVPKGSGLGTSSILSAACVKGIFEFMGKHLTDNEIYDKVLLMEQIMSTGGGWQDQVGGLTNGIKFITTKPGANQNISVKKIDLSMETQKELNERFALIYTGQRRLARNLLRDVVGNYIGANPQALTALKAIKSISALMRFELEQGNIDNLAMLFNRHWELSKQLDSGCTNTCIEQIFMSCEDLIDGRFIAGAGGGGFLQVILKTGITKQTLSHRLHEFFGDSGVDVWDSEIIF